MMKKLSFRIPLMIAFVLIFTTVFSGFFTTSTVKAEDNRQRVYDTDNLLSDSEISKLETAAAKYSEKWGYDFLILTTRNQYESDTISQSDSFYSEYSTTYSQPDCIIYTIDMGCRYADVSAQGEPQTKRELDNSRCTKVFEKTKSNLSDGKYYDACIKYIKTVNSYLKVKPGINPDNIFLKLWFQILLSFGIGGLVVGIMAFNSGGKVTTTSVTYLDSKTSRIVARHDHYIRTTTTRTKRSSDSGGGSSGGSIGGSGSHGGGHF